MGAPTTALASAPSASSSRLDSARVMSAMPAAPPRWLSLAAVLAASLAGCTRQAVEAAAMQAVVDDFNRSQDRIEVRFLSVSEVDTKLLFAASSGHPPDVAGLWSENIPDFSEKGA